MAVIDPAPDDPIMSSRMKSHCCPQCFSSYSWSMASISPEVGLSLWSSDDVKPGEKTGDSALVLAILRAQLKQNKIAVPPGEQCVKILGKGLSS